MSLDEFAYQLAYRNLHPPMDYRMEFMIAQLTALFVAANKGKKGKDPSPGDFMLSAMMEERQEQEDIAAKVRATFSLFKRKE